jgi:mannose-6-phosphate isomerase-like protein (cupin superfamily)
MEKVVKMSDVQVETGPSSFAALLRQQGDEIRRDVFNLILPQDTDGGVLHAGYTMVYPGCRTKGHTHPDREEVYYFVRGRGVMGVDGREYPVSAGDTFYVPFGPPHTTRNPYSEPLEFFWITIQKKV